jgi:hypothetical protein
VSVPVLHYQPDPPTHKRSWVRAVSWVAVACGTLFWGSAFLARSFHYRLPKPWIILVTLLTVLGIVLGLIGTVSSRARSIIAWIGLLMNLAIVGLFAYVFIFIFPH